MDKRKMYEPYQDAAEWARKHLPRQKGLDKLILLARRLEKLPLIEAAFNSGEVPWTKVREIARIADEDTEEVWLNAARRLTSRELEEEVRGKKQGDKPGGGLKARRKKYREEVLLLPEDKALYDSALRVLRKVHPGFTPAECVVEMARLALKLFHSGELGPEGKKVLATAVDLLVLHRGADGKTWAHGTDGRLEIDPGIIEEKIRSGARVIEVQDVEGAGVCSAIPFGQRGKVPPEDRDAAVSQELKEAVLARDGCCLVCGTRENLGPHHLDSHADGGKSDMKRLVTACLDCQGLLH